MRHAAVSSLLVAAGTLAVPAAAAGCGVEGAGHRMTAETGETVATGRAETFGSEVIAELATGEGTILVELYPLLAPAHVRAFTDRANGGVYDESSFHRVVEGYLVQAGDPTDDPGFGTDAREPLPLEPNDLSHLRGTLSMARLGHPDTAGSQFFLLHGDAAHLDGKYTAFGRMLSGYETLDAIASAPAQDEAPLEPVALSRVTVRARTDDDPPSGQ